MGALVPRLNFCVAVIVAVVLAATAETRAAQRKSYDGPQWPNVTLDEPQWPNVRLDDDPPVNPRPAFIRPEKAEDRVLVRKPSVAAKQRSVASPVPPTDGLDANASAAYERWPTLQPSKQPWPFVFEAGARYWYSSGAMNFGFSNGHPLFGSPTSTLDWQGLNAHSGEVFARLDHIPSGVFVKGMLGGGTVANGHIDDRDFFVTQFKFSDTTSQVNSGNLSFAMVDAGWAFWPVPNLKLGFFAGYHYWHEKATAYGLRCNMVSFLGCPAPGAVVEGFETAVGIYEPTWHAVRLGFEGKVAINERWSVSGEIAAVPYASLRNDDSHLLRQSADDLGPAPNVVSRSKYAYGVEAEVFANYAVTRNIEIGAGVRYWGLATRNGGVRFGPDFATNNTLNNFDHQRYGILVQAKGRF
jgi:hypothetical protein